MSRKYFIMCLVCVFWTVLQTSFHLVFVVFSYYMAICEQSPKEAHEIFFYLTYLYNSDCSKPILEKTNAFNSSPDVNIFKFLNRIYMDNTSSVTLEEVVEVLLEKINLFPINGAEYSARTSVFLLCFIILDGAWIVSAVSLLMGTCFGIKQSLSLVFYGPWLVMTICVAIFDATASVFFGFDIPSTMKFSDWLTFVGITDPSQFSEFADLPMTITIAPSLTLCSVSARFILIWIFNWIAFCFVMKATVSVYRESYKNENPNRPRTLNESLARRNRVDPDTSAARIRNWQIFYGTVGASSVHSTKSVESEKDLNSNSRESREVQNEIASPGSSTSNFYYAYPDVADNVVVDAGHLEELRGQLPWSYTQPQERKGSVEEKIELDLMPKKHFRVKLDSSSSGTEL